MEDWYVVHTHARAELLAAGHLERQGFDVYLPLYGKRRSHARRVERVAAPLFPRYLFVSMDPDAKPWLCVRSTVGVASVVCNGSRPVPLPARVLEEIRSREDGSGLVALARDEPFAIGARLRIVDGPFTHQLGLCEGMASNERVMLLLDLLGQSVRINVPLQAVRADA